MGNVWGWLRASSVFTQRCFVLLQKTVFGAPTIIIAGDLLKSSICSITVKNQHLDDKADYHANPA